MSAIIVLGIVGMYVAAGASFLLGIRRAIGGLSIGDLLLIVAGGLSLVLVLIPPLHAVLFKIRWGRVWAMARLSQKEAIRNRVFLVFMAFALIFLFADWFVGGKPADQVRNYVRVLYWSISPIFLLTAALLGAFSIPNDIKNMSIHTIVTKPIEKFEVVLGRFLGYAVVLTLSLIVVSGLSLIYVARGVSEDAHAPSASPRAGVRRRRLLPHEGKRRTRMGIPKVHRRSRGQAGQALFNMHVAIRRSRRSFAGQRKRAPRMLV
ncbi:MAG: hypothetical protein U0744_11095 [Gemmataceae bacterium]